MALYSTTGKQYVGSRNLHDSQIVWSPDLVDNDNGNTIDGSVDDVVTATPIVISNGTSTSLIAPQGAGINIGVTDVTICNTAGSGVTVDLRNGASGPVMWTFPVPSGGGVTHSFQEPLQFVGNSGVYADPSASGSTITMSINARKYN